MRLWASRLDAAIARTNRMKQIEITPAKAEPPPAGPAPTPLSASMIRLRRASTRAQPKHTGKVYSVEHESKSRPTAKEP